MKFIKPLQPPLPYKGNGGFYLFCLIYYFLSPPISSLWGGKWGFF